MPLDSESPIIVTGVGRSGTTWMQWLLSQHPRIHIHGQSPNLPWCECWQWYRRLVAQGQWSITANRHHGYRIAHYAGSPPGRCREAFKRLLHDYLTGHGPAKARWGLKWLGLAGGAEPVSQFESLWPETRWVVCIRDPFATINSAKNTFLPELDPVEHAAEWVRTCEFTESADPGRVVTVQIDQLALQDEAHRRRAVLRVLDCVGEEPCEGTEEFVRTWPVVHKVTDDSRRRFRLSAEERSRLLDAVGHLAQTMEKLGYDPKGPSEPCDD